MSGLGGIFNGIGMALHSLLSLGGLGGWGDLPPPQQLPQQLPPHLQRQGAQRPTAGAKKAPAPAPSPPAGRR